MLHKMIETFKNKNKKLVFFGADHSKSMSQIRAIQKTIADFKPTIVLVESGWHKARFLKTKMEAIGNGGEMGFAVYYSRKLDIKVDSNDPPESYCAKKIAEKYSKELSFLFFMLRRFTHAGKNIKLEDYFNNSAGYFWHGTRWKNFKYTFAHFKKIFKRYLKEEFNSKGNYLDYQNPTLDINVLNKISRDESIIRDRYMLRKIKRLLKKHNRIFVIKGSGHLFSQRENLEKLFNNLT